MDKLSELLKYVQKTNPEMDRKHLEKELEECKYSTILLIFIWENSRKTESLSS